MATTIDPTSDKRASNLSWDISMLVDITIAFVK